MWKVQPPEGTQRGMIDLNPGEHPNLARRFDSGHMVHILGDGLNGQSSFQAKLAVGKENFLRGKYTPLNNRVNRKSDSFSVNSNVYSVP